MSELEIKSINDLLDKEFYIPDYQRGYRWSKSEVLKLLEDIRDFFDKDNLTKESFYCLQPLVVCKSKENINNWEIIDGQQRLTTILIILNNLKTYLDDEEKTPFSISYQTRPNSKQYLSNITSESKNTNIDFFHIYEADKTVKNFFKNNSKGKFYSHLSNSNSDGKNVRFIWYDVTDEIELGKVKPTDIFTRLNIGKIPLTNAELIKALFLSKTYLSDNMETAKEIQLRIAQDWDRIEKCLQQDDFWYFIYGNKKYDYSTRIEFLFDILKNNSHKNDEEPRHTFNEYYTKFENSTDKHSIAEREWKEVTKLFGIFENWYDDRVLYHLIGCNTTIGISISKLLVKLGNAKSNSDFKKTLLESMRFKKKQLEEMSYENGADIKRVLLMFNVLSMLRNKKSNNRFPFQYYLQQDWDIEHISPQTEQDVSGKDLKNWVLMNISYFTGVSLPLTRKEFDEEKFLSEARTNKNESKEINEFINNLFSLLNKDLNEQEKREKFNELRENLFNFFETDQIKEKNDISNLVLLDAGTNRMYKNAFFPVKRKWIIEREKQGVFVPLCTKNVFLKAYSSDFSNLNEWTQNDADSYLKQIENILKNPEFVLS